MRNRVLALLLSLPLSLGAITNMKANGLTEVTVTSIPTLLTLTADLSRVGAVLKGGVFADVNENGILDPVDYSWNWRYGTLIDGVGWIIDPARPLASILGDDGRADGKLNVLFPLLRQQVKLWPNGSVFIFMQDEDGSSGVVRLNLRVPASAPALTGRITDAVSGVGAAGLSITAMQQTGGDPVFATGRTDADGRYVMLLDAGTWDLYVDGGGWGTGRYEFAQVQGITVPENEIVNRDIPLARFPAVIRGTVLHEDGTPVPNLILYSPGANFLTARTDADGRYVMGTTPGFAQIGVIYNMLANFMHLSRYYESPRFQNVTAVSGAEVTADFTLKPYPSFIRGKCTLDGRPVLGAEITAQFTDPADSNTRSSTALSDENGEFLIGVMPGTVSDLEVWVNGLSLVSPPGPLTGIAVSGGQTVDAGEFRFAVAQGTNGISGTVTGPGGAPAAGVYVAAVEQETLFHDSYFFQYTDAEGRFSFTGLKNGEWRIGVYRTGGVSVPAMSYHTLSGAQQVAGVQFALSWDTPVARAPETSAGSFVLEGNYPNPFNGNTEIRFTAPRSGRSALTVVDAAGRVVRRIGHVSAAAGRQVIRWDGRDDSGREAGSGIYAYILEAGGVRKTGKMALVR